MTLPTVRCPACGAQITADSQDGSNVVECRFCGTRTAAGASAVPQPPSPVFVVQQPRGNPAAAAIIAGVVAVLLLAGGVVAVTALRHGAVTPTTSPGSPFALGGAAGGAGKEDTLLGTRIVEFGSEGTAPGQLTDARNIAVDHTGNVWVCDWGDGRLQKLDPTGKFLQLVTIPPRKGDSDSTDPIVEGMVADYAGHLYVARRGDILKFQTEDGKLLAHISGSFPETWYDSLAVDATNAVYAVAKGDVVKLSPDGKVAARFHDLPKHANKKDPQMGAEIAVDGVGGIFLGSGFGEQVYVFDAKGTFSNRFGQRGDKPGEFTTVGQVAVDGKERVFVDNFGTVDMFEANGRYLGKVAKDYKKGSIMGITIDAKGHLWTVTNKGVVAEIEVK